MVRNRFNRQHPYPSASLIQACSLTFHRSGGHFHSTESWRALRDASSPDLFEGIIGRTIATLRIFICCICNCRDFRHLWSDRSWPFFGRRGVAPSATTYQDLSFCNILFRVGGLVFGPPCHGSRPGYHVFSIGSFSTILLSPLLFSFNVTFGLLRIRCSPRRFQTSHQAGGHRWRRGFSVLNFSWCRPNDRCSEVHSRVSTEIS